MKNDIKLENRILTDSLETSGRFRSRLRKVILGPLVCSVCASIGVFGGISFLFVGLVCVAVHGLVSGDTVFDRVGTVLLITAIPLILAGSMFLDQIQNKNQ